MNHWKLMFLFFVLSFVQKIAAQESVQNIRGVVVDKDSQSPLIGVNVVLLNSDPLIGATTDLEGHFKIENVTISRHDIIATYLGYEPVIINNIDLEAGKELVLNVEMVEAVNVLNEVVVSSKNQLDKTKALNEFATLSARTFSIEETARYAFSNFDPARMAQNYAGVNVGSGDDLFNEIVIRGNSPSGVMWRLEGVEIPNPNHFGTMGNSGGAISMLSSSMLTNSDFYTGAFPSEFGNATSGVFDLKMRNGNNEKHEYSFMLGLLGIEFAAEGPFTKKSKSSYLINYRYSTLDALDAIGLNPTGDIFPAYQDLSFKVNLPTKSLGVFGVFGLAGSNQAASIPDLDTLSWTLEDDNLGFVKKQNLGVFGITNRYLFNNKSYLKTILMTSVESNDEDEFWMDKEESYEQILEQRDRASNKFYRLSSTYSNKLNARNTWRSGFIISYNDFNFQLDQRNVASNELENLFDNNGATGLLQFFTQLKHRFNKNVTFNLGLHYTQMTFNNKYAIEPRAAFQWKVNNKNTICFSSGLHSKMEQIGIYLFDGFLPDGSQIYPKGHLGLTKSFHNVFAYDLIFDSFFRLKTEIYYQHLFNVPIENDEESIKSLINASDIWDALNIGDAIGKGTGRNIGIDVTLEKFFNKKYYFLLTGSLYDSKFKTLSGKYYNTKFNGNYQLNILGGKEFLVGINDKKTLSVNGKFVLSGGSRRTPIDEGASKVAGREILLTEHAFESRSGVYYRFDLGFSYKINTKKSTHTIMLDFQNVTWRKNVGGQFYDPVSNQIETYYQTTFLPNLNYRIEW